MLIDKIKIAKCSQCGFYLSESVTISLGSLLNKELQLLVLLVPLMDFIEARQQTNQQHGGNQAQHREDDYGQWRQLIG